MLVRYIHIQIFDNSDDTACLRSIAVAGDNHKVNADLAFDLSYQIAHEERGALQYTNDDQILLLIVLRYLLA